MKSDKADPRQKRAKRSSSGGGRPRKPIDMNALREQIRDVVAENALAMVETAIEEVDKGHYLAMKYLFEMIGLFPGTAVDTEESPQEESLAKTLLRRLRLTEPEPEPVSTNVEQAPADAVSTDLVK